jgi:hypothetical protein
LPCVDSKATGTYITRLSFHSFIHSFIAVAVVVVNDVSSRHSYH